MSNSANIYDKLQAIIGTDAGNRGMKQLIVEGDLQLAAETLASLTPGKHVVVLSGFPCCVDQTPPTETDGPPGTLAIARMAAMLGYSVTVVTEYCNHAVFAAALDGLAMPSDSDCSCSSSSIIQLECFPSTFAREDEDRFQRLCQRCDLLISCERAGEARDGNCYTMRGINMNNKGLIGPLNRLVTESQCQLISIGDGGNELGMGKVYDKIVHNPKIVNGEQIGCVVPADYLIAASVSNWGGYALAAAAAVARAQQQQQQQNNHKYSIKQWIDWCLPTTEEEVTLLRRCVAAGCRDGVSGQMEATVDGMPLETSMKCLEDLRFAAITSDRSRDNE
ncbi:protein of unknown function DUF4392 containing protein [Nitzschia inconspicua]|uniref:D-glutamate cyclase-like C-terminal domain-containing protein n=1 Tax=Nitzschia inconspicua TaxID=303405 RepID=A0A9K3PDN4_9STRA|nr:protein of unknown function DUF4392 containing protein [Nitzschia inconspicua]